MPANKLVRFRVVFEGEASEFLIAQTKRKRRKLLDIAYAIADSPFAETDYSLLDSDERKIPHIATEADVI